MTGPALPRPLPAGEAISWRPAAASGAGATDACPIYVRPKVLQVLHEHFQTTPKHGVLGFLVGDLCHDAPSGASHVMVDSTVRLNQPIYGDRVGVVLEELWGRVQSEIEQVGGHLLGWYHSHPPGGTDLASGDIETHLRLFTRPWQFALVLGAEATGPAAGFYRPAHDAFSATTRLSFHELAGPGGSEHGTAKRSSLPWTNFVTDEPVVYREHADAARGAAGITRATLEVTGRQPSAKPVVPPAAPEPSPVPAVAVAPATPPVPRPKALTGLPLIHEEPAAAPPAARSPSPAPRRPPAAQLRPGRRVAREPRHSPQPPRRRWRAVALTLVLAGAAVGAWRSGLLRLPLGGTASPPDYARLRLDHLDQVVDTLVRAVADYAERARQFDGRRLGCDGLQRGLVAVEQGWVAYNTVSRTRVPVLDAARARHDRTLYASVDSVARHFQTSQCERP